MKAIAINDANIEAIKDAINSAEGKATQRTMTVSGLTSLIKQLEANSAVALLPKKFRTGITAWLQQSHKLPSSYKYSAEATGVKVAWRAKDGWHLVDVQRVRNIETAKDKIDVVLPDAAAAEAQKRFADTFRTA